MAMVVQHNAAAQLALGELNKNVNKVGELLGKVSSGQKLNSAKDDSASFCISEKMREQIRTLLQDNQNVQNGSALFKIADGGINSIVEELRNLKELAINSANDTNTDIDRATMQKEFSQRMANINDVATETNYNGKRLLDGTYAKMIVIGTREAEHSEIIGYKEENVVIRKPSATKSRQSDGVVAVQENNNNSELAKNFKSIDSSIIQSSNPRSGRGIIGDIEFSGYNSTWNWASKMKEAGSLSGGGYVHGVYGKDGVDYDAPQIGVSMNFTFASTNPTIQDLDKEGFSILCGACTQYINIVFDASITNANSTFVRSTTDDRNTTYTIGIGDLGSVNNDTLSEAIFNGVNSVSRSDKYLFYGGSGCSDYSEHDVNLNSSTTVSTLLDRAHDVRVALNPDYDANDSSKGTKYIFTKEKSPAMIFIGSGALVAVDEPKSIQGNKEVITFTSGETMKVNTPIYKYTVDIENIYGRNDKPLVIHHGPKANQKTHFFIGNMHTKYLGSENIYTDDATLPPYERIRNQQDRDRYEALSYDGKKQEDWLETLKLANNKNLDDISVTTQKNANVAIRVLDGALEYALNEATQVGSYLQRLEYTDVNITTMGENIQSAESTIRDADMAKEMTEYTKFNVLTQSAQAMLAQANQNSSGVLSLLQ